jgi:transcriptional regulator with XRE-family HTH domain
MRDEGQAALTLVGAACFLSNNSALVCEVKIILFKGFQSRLNLYICKRMEKITLKQLGLNLRKLREFRDISRSQLADMVNSTERTIANYENGHTDPTVSKMMKIANVLNTPLVTLFCLHENTHFQVSHNDANSNTNNPSSLGLQNNEVKLIALFEKQIAALEARIASEEKNNANLLEDKLALRAENALLKAELHALKKQ